MGIHEDVESESEENLVSEELEAEDFERTPRPSGSVPDYVQELSSPPAETLGGSNDLPKRTAMARSGSMATVRLQRRAKLAEKLKDVFELKDIDEVWAEMPCWLLRSVCECLVNAFTLQYISTCVVLFV
jgi:sterol 3beta-glucosyltransferase